MSKNIKPPSVESASVEEGAPVAVHTLSSDALARRRMLLKSLGKGSAVVAATAIPIHSLAAPVTISTKDNTQCIVSGMGSAIHSKTTATGFCKGSNPSVYVDPTTWPGYNSRNRKFTVGGATYGENVKFKAVFGGSDNSKLTDIMAATTVDPRKVWIAAWLNAGAGHGKPYGTTAQNFPYSPDEVVTRYKNTSSGPSGNQRSYEFFIKYLQSS